MALAEILKTFKTVSKRGILSDVDRYLIKRKGPDIGRPYETRAKGVHHPSSVSAEDCLRCLVYGWLNTQKSNPSKDPKGQRIFDTGHDFGYRMQGYFWDMGLLLGEWHCVRCGHTWVDMENPSPRDCPNCEAEFEIWYDLHYLEVPLWDEKYNIAGRSDGCLMRPWGRQLIELKTIKNRDITSSPHSFCFEDLSEPKPSHRYQLNIYLDMAGRLYGRKHSNDLRHGLIIYGAKNNQLQKEFEITLMDEVVAPMYVKMETIEQCLKDGVLPARGGDNKSCYQCRYCDYLDFCWSDHTFVDADMRRKEDEG